MRSNRVIAASAVLLGLTIAAGCSSPAAPRQPAHSGAQAQNGAADATSTPSSTPSEDRVTMGGEAFKAAFDRLDAAGSAVYQVEVVARSGDYRATRMVTVDAKRQLQRQDVELRVKAPGTDPQILSFSVVNAEDGTAFGASSPGAGERATTWRKVDEATADMFRVTAGVSVGPGRVSTIVPGLESFSVTDFDPGARRLKGTVPASSGLWLLGLDAVASSAGVMFDGLVPVEVLLDPSGEQIQSVLATGAGHTIKPSSGTLPKDVLALIQGATATVKYISVGKAVTIRMPSEGRPYEG